MSEPIMQQSNRKERGKNMFEILQNPFVMLLLAAAAGGIGFAVVKHLNRQKPVNPPPRRNKPDHKTEVPLQPDPEMRRLAQELAELEQELEWLDGLNEHSKLLHSLLEPLQVLIGCSDAASGLTENQRLYFLEPRALHPLSAAADRLSRLPQCAPALAAPAKADVEANLQLPAEDLQGRVREWKRRVKVKSGLQRDYELLLELEKAGLFHLSEKDAEAAGKKAAELLRKHGIYPLYRDDVMDRPELRVSFNQGSSIMTACPGLFLCRNDRYELFAAYNGIWV